jgi:exportin-2 (importin alpha re-exporter)
MQFAYETIAELALKAEEKQQGFSLLLLQIVHNESLPQQNRLSAALYFKNFIRFNYVVCWVLKLERSLD